MHPVAAQTAPFSLTGERGASLKAKEVGNRWAAMRQRRMCTRKLDT
jgi:hypothetical protein